MLARGPCVSSPLSRLVLRGYNPEPVLQLAGGGRGGLDGIARLLTMGLSYRLW